jgi:PhnB protein
MAIALNPYLQFPGTAREAMEFYRSVFGGELSLQTFAEGMGSDDPAQKDLIMHGHLDVGGGTTFMGSDGASGGSDGAPPPGATLALSGEAEDSTRLSAWFAALSEGGSVTEPLVTAPWGDVFGTCTDRFGTNWMVNIAGSAGGS